MEDLQMLRRRENKVFNVSYFEQWLDKYMNFERSPDAKLFRLETTEKLAEYFNHPELSYKTFHITGSKGKGSVSKMLACVLSEKNPESPVGIYASPHVYDFRERVSSANGFFDDEIYEKTIEKFTKKIDSLENRKNIGSWFELNAAFSFLLFKEAGCKNAVFEVGMGGRLDATNVIKPELSFITEIELEHTKYLGDTLEKIAFEKAGIIKKNTPVVVSGQKNKSVEQVFIEKAKSVDAPIYFVDDYAKITKIDYSNSRMNVKIEGEIFAKPIEASLQLLSPVQAKNAMQVAVAMKILEPETDEEIIARGLEKATMPGRFEIRDNIVLDGAHTPASILNTVETFEKLYGDRKKYLIFGAAEGKDLNNIVPIFKNKFDKIFVTKPGDFKKSNLSEIENEFMKNNIEIVSGENYKEIISSAIKQANDDGAILLATGSFYLLDEVDKIWNKK